MYIGGLEAGRKLRRQSLRLRAWGKLPDRIARDRNLDAVALVLTAYRLTLIDWHGLHHRDVQKIAARGLSKKPFQLALRTMRRLGLLERESYISRSDGRGRYFARDRLTELCEAGPKNCRRIERRWFDGNLTVKALALLIFARALGRHDVSPEQVRQRFGWSLQTVRRTACELVDAGFLIQFGALQQPRYGLPKSTHQPQIGVPRTDQNGTDGKGTDEKGTDENGTTYIVRKILPSAEERNEVQTCTHIDAVLPHTSLSGSEPSFAGRLSRQAIDKESPSPHGESQDAERRLEKKAPRNAARPGDVPRSRLMLDILLVADGAKTLSRKLRGDDRGLARFLYEHGAHAIETMADVLRRHMIEGRGVGSVTSWGYFEPAVADEKHRRQLGTLGIRPGDVFSAHRVLPCTPEKTRRKKAHQLQNPCKDDERTDRTTQDTEEIIVF